MAVFLSADGIVERDEEKPICIRAVKPGRGQALYEPD